MWNIVAWVLQALLAVAFLLPHGILYVFAPEPMVRLRGGTWPPAGAFPGGFRVFIGVAEMLAAVCLVLPGLFHVLTFLTPLAAAGVVLRLIGAVVYQVRRNELAGVRSAAVLLVMSAVVVYVRWQVVVL